MVIPAPPDPHRSPRVRELSQRLRTVIQDFQHQFPLTPAEVRQALRDAGSRTGEERPRGLSVQGRILFWVVVLGVPWLLMTIIRALR